MNDELKKNINIIKNELEFLKEKKYELDNTLRNNIIIDKNTICEKELKIINKNLKDLISEVNDTLILIINK